MNVNRIMGLVIIVIEGRGKLIKVTFFVLEQGESQIWPSFKLVRRRRRMLAAVICLGTWLQVPKSEEGDEMRVVLQMTEGESRLIAMRNPVRVAKLTKGRSPSPLSNAAPTTSS